MAPTDRADAVELYKHDFLARAAAERQTVEWIAGSVAARLPTARALDQPPPPPSSSAPAAAAFPADGGGVGGERRPARFPNGGLFLTPAVYRPVLVFVDCVKLKLPADISSEGGGLPL